MGKRQGKVELSSLFSTLRPPHARLLWTLRSVHRRAGGRLPRRDFVEWVLRGVHRPRSSAAALQRFRKREGVEFLTSGYLEPAILRQAVDPTERRRLQAGLEDPAALRRLEIAFNNTREPHFLTEAGTRAVVTAYLRRMCRQSIANESHDVAEVADEVTDRVLAVFYRRTVRPLGQRKPFPAKEGQLRAYVRKACRRVLSERRSRRAAAKQRFDVALVPAPKMLGPELSFVDHALLEDLVAIPKLEIAKLSSLDRAWVENFINYLTKGDAAKDDFLLRKLDRHNRFYSAEELQRAEDQFHQHVSRGKHHLRRACLAKIRARLEKQLPTEPEAAERVLTAVVAEVIRQALGNLQ